MHFVVEAGLLENWKVIVPKFDAGVEDQPTLFGLLTKLNSIDDVVQERLLLVSELLLLLGCEFSFVLVFLQSDEVNMTDLDVFVKEELHLDFSEVDVGHTLCNDQVTVFLGVPLVLDAEGSRIIGDLN